LVTVKLSQLIMSAAIAAATTVGFAGVAAAAPAPICAQGALTAVVDDNGVQHEACVESAADVPPVAAPVKASLAPQPTPTTGPSTSAAKLPATGTGTGGLVIAFLLVGSGSIASLVSRRKS
jgi:LPXTG-motif cell wall-anchored protein